jgi:tRNA(Ile)-lysidine synthase
VAVVAKVAQPIGAAEFSAAMASCLADGAPWPAAVAVSGGSDSLALMLLIAGWAQAASRPLPIVLTVDHGLTAQSKEVARAVVREARRSGLEAHALVWRGPKPSADIEAEARAARYALMGQWCAAHDMRALFAAHTLDDQAETFLLRLARGSGLDGLSAMRAVSAYHIPGFAQIKVVRPLLGIRRAALRHFLASSNVAWFEDPMNDDPKFARVRVRQAWPLLEDIGLSPERIAAASGHLARAREALESATEEFLDKACRFEPDRAVVDGTLLGRVSSEVGLRALACILSRLSGTAYRPRFERLQKLYLAIRSGELRTARTLHGCRVGRAAKSAAIFGPETLVVTRERDRMSVRKDGVAASSQIS